jgi:hypothetical protein
VVILRPNNFRELLIKGFFKEENSMKEEKSLDQESNTIEVLKHVKNGMSAYFVFWGEGYFERFDSEQEAWDLVELVQTNFPDYQLLTKRRGSHDDSFLG